MVEVAASSSRDGPSIVASKIVKGYPGVQALTGIDLSVYPGRIHALLGENGAGKSTLLKILSGVEQPDSGTLSIDGAETSISSPRMAAQLGLSTVHQELAIVPQLSLADNVVLGRERSVAGLVDRKAAIRVAKELMRSLGYEGSVTIRAGEASVATQQLTEIARLLYRDQRVLMLDEPTASLSGPEVDRLHQIVLRLKSEGRAIVYISHRLQEILDLQCEDVTVLRDGAVTGRFTSAGGYTEQDLVQSMVGRSVTMEPLRPRPRGEVVLEVTSLRRGPSSPEISFSVHAGEIVGLAGMVGSGRTELMRAVVGADRAWSGDVRVAGKDLGLPSVREGIAAGVAMLPEDRKSQGLVLGMSIADNVNLPDPPTRLGISRRKTRDERAAEVTAMVGLDRKVSVAAGSLSGGNQQKVVLARWVLRQCPVYVFDEPTRGVDIGAKQEIHAEIERLAKAGAAIIVISSELVEVLALSDRILVMKQGVIVSEFTRESASEELILRDAARS